jgi:hypothetical protein
MLLHHPSIAQMFVLDPIFKIFEATMNNKKEQVFPMLGESNVLVCASGSLSPHREA